MRSFCANLHVDPSLPAVSVTSGTYGAFLRRRGLYEKDLTQFYPDPVADKC